MHALAKLVAVAALATPIAMPAPAAAQEWPSRTITIVVPFPPGSATDNLVRPVAAALQRSLGQPVVIDNKPGAQGVLGTEAVARAKPDGYTLLAGSSTTLAANVGLFKALPYDPVRDFTPIVGLGATSMMFMVRADSPAKDLKGLLELARKSPMPAAYGSSSAQVAIAMLTRATGVEFNPIAYKGTPQALTDLVGGAVPLAIVDVGNGVPYVKSGRATAVAISAPARSPSAPDVPALSESYPDTALVTWIALVAPAGTPVAIVERVRAATAAALGTAEIRERFAAVSTDVDLVAPAALADRMKRDQARWIDLIRAAGIPPQ